MGEPTFQKRQMGEPTFQKRQMDEKPLILIDGLFDLA